MVLALTSPFGSGRSEVMTVKSMARIALGMLWGVSLALYIAAKIDFFTHYDPLRVGTYLREHNIYWLGIAASGFLIWLIVKRVQKDRL
jgi:hypothetical protein